MKRLISLLVGLASLLTLQAQAQTAPDDLPTCLELARENYPAIKKYDLIEKTKDYNVSNAARTWIPQVSLTAQATWQTDVPTFPEEMENMLSAQGIDMNDFRQDQYKIALNVKQNIWDGGSSAAERKIAEAEAEAQRYLTDIEMETLEERVENLYFAIMLLDKRLEQNGITMSMLRNNLDRVKALCKNGAALDSDADMLEAELLSLEQKQEEIETCRDNYRQMMEYVIGTSLGEGNLQCPMFEGIAEGTSARIEYQLFDARSNILEMQKKKIKSASMPRFTAFAQGYYGYPGFDVFEAMCSPDLTFNALLGVRMVWNFGSYYTQKNRVNQLTLNQNQINISRDIFSFNNHISEIQQNGEILHLKKTLEKGSEIVELRKKVRMAAESKYENGVIEATDLMKTINDESSAETDMSTHEIELLQAQYKLKRILNL